MFYGRKQELDKLNAMYKSGHFEFAVIYGRRRVGKTTLIRELIKDKEAIFFAANESTARDNLQSLSRSIAGTMHAPIYNDYESALSAVFESAAEKRLIFVIDEYPYLAGSYRGISSLLQIMIDHKKDTSKLMLILCGSSMSFMEGQILGYQSPLYGRRTAQFKILPFTFFESMHFMSDFSDIDKALLYGATGGIPEYLSRINAQQNAYDNIINLFFTTSGYLFEEPSNLLKQELREPSVYNVIIESIAGGATRLHEIATKSGLDSNICSKYLSSLMSLGLVGKEYPFGDRSGRRSIYKLYDNMFRFWYRFVFQNISAITAGLGSAVFTNSVEPQLNAYMGFIFEEICKQWLYEMAKENALPFFIGNLGRWWGTNPVSRAQEEIDIMARNDGEALFAECKWKNEAADMDVYQDLLRKSAMFPGTISHLYIFTKMRFSNRLQDLRRDNDRLHLLTLSEMIESNAANK